MFAAISPSDRDADVVPIAPPLPRSFGALDIAFVRRNGKTSAERVFQSGVLRSRFPNVARGSAPEAVLINTAGGLTGGDLVTTNIEMGEASHALVTTQAHEKVYRALWGEASVASTLKLGARSRLDWLPQPTILFDRARLCRETRVVMAADAVFLGVESVVFGRTAMGETMKTGLLCDRWMIERDGAPIHADSFEVAGDVAELLARPSVLAGNAAMATLRYVAPDAEDRLSEMRDLVAESGGASAWNGMLLMRLVAADGYRLGHALSRVLVGLRRTPLPPVWNI
jgi:urease accessory protein